MLITHTHNSNAMCNFDRLHMLKFNVDTTHVHVQRHYSIVVQASSTVTVLSSIILQYNGNNMCRVDLHVLCSRESLTILLCDL